jgi:predicted metalloprotease with PDZ domain
MRALWQRFGQTGIGVGEDDVRRVAEELSGLTLKRFFADTVHGTIELPIKKLLAPFGIALEWETAKSASPSLGVKTSNDGNDVKLATVYDGGTAQAAGLSAGDVLLAINGLRVTPARLDKQLARHQPGDTLNVHAFRRDELMTFAVRLDPPPADSAKLTLVAKSERLRRGWLT